jgi:hypothetical protein
MNNTAKLKIMKDTIFCSIMTPIQVELKNKVPSTEKREELLNLAQNKLQVIINSFTNQELIPKFDFKTQEDFERHLQRIIAKSKERLMFELKQSV